MSPEDWRKLLVRRAKAEGAPVEDPEATDANVRDIQLERAVDVLKGVMIFQSQNGLQEMASSAL